MEAREAFGPSSNLGQVTNKLRIMKKILWLDDKRNPMEKHPTEKGTWISLFSPIQDYWNCEIVWLKKYDEFVSWITENGLPDAICFDHDLSDIHISKSTYKEKTGYDCVKWLVEYCLDNNIKELPKWSIQSSNPCGKDNINGHLLSFIKNVE